MSKNLNQIIGELFARPMDSKELAVQVQKLGEELRKAVYDEGTMAGKFQGLLASFRAIIPDERQRFQAALQALSTTSKLGRGEIIKAVGSQQEELKIVEKSLQPMQQGWRDAAKGLEARSQQLKGEIAQLRARLAQLEGEDASVQAALASHAGDLVLAEGAMKDLFAKIGAEIEQLAAKIEQLTAEAPSPSAAAVPAVPVAVLPAAQQVPPPAPASVVASAAQNEQTESSEQTAEPAAEAPKDAKFQRKCPMCAGQFNLLELENLWQCFSCGYEEPAEGGSKRPSATPEPAPMPEPAAEAKLWEPPANIAQPLTADVQESSKSAKPSSSSRQWTKKKDCPGCRKKMYFYPDDGAWRCSSCGYERREFK